MTFPPEVLNTNFPFEGIVTLRCRNCGTIFYNPLIAGDAAYYEHLSRNLSWYYSAKRWEYPFAVETLNKEKPDLFLEVGCGAGHFLRLARDRGYEGHGFEMNPLHLDSLRRDGFHVLDKLDCNGSPYGALFMFQVLEHLVDPFSFLQTLLPQIRSGGFLVLSTPVSPSCVGFAVPPFALPPHHQWMPTAVGFKLLAERLGLICETMTYDPPDVSQVMYGLKQRYGLRSDLKRPSLFLRTASRVVMNVAAAMRQDWAKVGHTGMVLLRKPSVVH